MHLLHLYNSNFTLAKQLLLSALTFIAAPIDGGFSNWTDYTECSATCGAGIKSRERACNNPLPENGGSDCVGEMTETVDCIIRACPGKKFPYIIRCVPRTQLNIYDGFTFFAKILIGWVLNASLIILKELFTGVLQNRNSEKFEKLLGKTPIMELTISKIGDRRTATCQNRYDSYFNYFG